MAKAEKFGTVEWFSGSTVAALAKAALGIGSIEAKHGQSDFA